MRVLLDTCILSELRNPKSTALLKNTFKRFESHDLFVSVITIGEIIKGIALLPSSKKKTELADWAMTIESSYVERILNIDCETVHVWGELTANAQTRGKIIPAADGLIAATALVNGLHIMTRNVSDFEPTGVLIFNPWG
ncbi:MAG: type II toxin-antitoxin system VapC family toxin [Gammaproteobacteria bacterium]|nr:type II toxin-antitoxin system VapC family toxin [Gammaproteobacteria bacterium]